MRLLELFAGTGSVGRVFRDAGWEVTSVDLEPKSGASVICDIMKWGYKAIPPGTFDAVWASPPCTHYSRARTTAKTPRDLEGADALVLKTLEIIEYFRPKWWFLENPGTGLLAKRFVVAGIPFKSVTYCSYGYPYRKLTYIWTNCATWTPRPVCKKDCAATREGKHIMTAQRGPIKGGDPADVCTVSQLYSIPPDLVKEILRYIVDQIFWSDVQERLDAEQGTPGG